MPRLLAAVLAALALTTGVADARPATALTYDVEYTGSYGFHREGTFDGRPSLTTDQRFTWSYRGQGTVDPVEQPGYSNPVLRGSVAIGGTLTESGGTTPPQNCTLGASGEDKPPGNIGVSAYGSRVAIGVFLPDAFMRATGCDAAGVRAGCTPSSCSTYCVAGPPAVSANGGDPDPVWAPSFGPIDVGETGGFERTVDMRPGTGEASSDSCFGGRGTEKMAVDVKSRVAVGIGWQGPLLFIRFADGQAPDVAVPGDLLTPGRSPATTPTAHIPPKVPLPPTQPDDAPPLIPGITIGCPPRGKPCKAVTVTVTDGAKRLAKADFGTLRRGRVARAGVKLRTLELGAAPKKVRVAVRVRRGGTVHRRSRAVTLTP